VGRRIRLVGVALAAALALAACGGGEEALTQAAPSASSPLVVDDGTLAAGEKIAAPKGDVVLTMTGDIGAANKDKKLELDLASLESLRRVRLEAAELRHVADRDQLVLHYQPIVELVSGRITRVEALVRWDHPTKGLLPPLAFIPLAEEQGLIGPIGDWVLLQACLQARRWQDQFPDAPPLSMHVNLSGRQLEEPRLIGEVVRALETARLSPRCSPWRSPRACW
jgi:hypothetical protein